MILRNYSARFEKTDSHGEKWRDATWAFGGGLNNHSRAAKRRMRELIVARFRG
jgi:stearoyl-CoA desaturase (Delta-9 desaturase)